MPAVDKSLLERWRTLPAEVVLRGLADSAKPDPTYRPLKGLSSLRWHVAFGQREFELLTTGPKFWDTRAQVGGGGAVDLAMHLAGASFKDAVSLLIERGL